MTRDHDYRQIVAVHAVYSSETVHPILVSERVFGASSPLKLLASQPILLNGWLLKALISQSEVIMSIGAFSNSNHVSKLPESASDRFVVPIFDEPELIQCNGVWLGCPGPGGGYARPSPSSDDQQMIVETGLFIRRPGEDRARRGCGVAAHG